MSPTNTSCTAWYTMTAWTHLRLRRDGFLDLLVQSLGIHAITWLDLDVDDTAFFRHGVFCFRCCCLDLREAWLLLWFVCLADEDSSAWLECVVLALHWHCLVSCVADDLMAAFGLIAAGLKNSCWRFTQLTVVYHVCNALTISIPPRWEQSTSAAPSSCSSCGRVGSVGMPFP